MKEFPRLNLTIEQLKELKTLYERSDWECLCTTIEHSKRTWNLRECRDEIRRVLGGVHVRLDEYMLGYRLAGNDARKLRIDWLNHEIARQRSAVPEPPEGFEYLGRGPVELPEDCEVASWSPYFGWDGWRINLHRGGNSRQLHYAVKRKPKKLGPWHVKETFVVGDRFKHRESIYIIACVGSLKTGQFYRLVYQLVNIRNGMRWSDRTIDSGSVAFELTAKQVAYLLGDRYKFTYVEK